MRLSDRPITEQGEALQVVMGALRIPRYPPVPGPIQAQLAAPAVALPPGVGSLRLALAGLAPAQFAAALQASMNPLREDEGFGLVGFGPMGGTLAAYGRALLADQDVDSRHVRHFERVGGYLAGEAVLMARFFGQILGHLGEPERSDFEASIVGSAPATERRERWARFVAKTPPAWLRMLLAGDEAAAGKLPIPSEHRSALVVYVQATNHARSWVAAWNAHDLLAVADHYADDVEYRSDTVASRTRKPDGTLRGKAAMLIHFQEGLRIAPRLRIELVSVFTAPGGYAALYRRENGNRAVHAVTLDAAGRIATACVYLADAQA